LNYAQKKITIKQVLTTNQSWWKFYEKYQNKIRVALLVCITKLLSCRKKKEKKIKKEIIKTKTIENAIEFYSSTNHWKAA
jgi:hypothetical protein